MVRQRSVQLGLSLALVLIPFLFVTFVPVSDLPQHAAQIRLLDELLGLEHATVELEHYTVRWWAPGNLVYGIFFLWARVLAPVAAARASMATLALLFVAALHFLSRSRERPPEHATLASLLVFSVSLYWGFVGFLLGAAAFLIALPTLLAPLSSAHPLRSLALLAAAIGGVYFTHSLWLVPASIALLLGAWQRDGRPTPRDVGFRALALVPAAVASLLWLPALRAERAASGFELGVRYLPLSERLSLEFLSDVLLGGLEGPIEPLLLVLLAAWVILAISRREGPVDRPLSILGALLLLFALLGPDAYLNTRHMNLRFGFVGGALIALASPALALRARLRQLLPAAALATLAISTTWAWRDVQARELDGLAASLALDPEPSRTLGLDYVGMSEVIRTPPFLQLFAWRQALHGGEVSFSFAEHQAGIVGASDARPSSATPGLEWRADLAHVEDLRAFDHVLVVGALPDELAPALLLMSEPDTRVRLYRVRH